MTPFGLRKRVKDAVKTALGLDAPSPSSTPPPPPRPAPPKPAEAPPPRPSHGAPPAPAVPAGDVPPGTMWVQGARMDELLPDSCKVVTVLGRRIALFNVDGELYATENSCPHAGGQLGEGDLDGAVVTCPFHAYTFDVRTGECTGGQTDAVATVRLKIDDNLVLFEV